MTRERSAEEFAGAARRMIRALGRRVGREDPVDLALIEALHEEVTAAYLVALQGQREMGFSLAEIGAGAGKSKQAIAQRLMSGTETGDRSA